MESYKSESEKRNLDGTPRIAPEHLEKIVQLVQMHMNRSNFSEPAINLLTSMNIKLTNLLVDESFTDDEKLKACMVILKQIEGIKPKPGFTLSNIFKTSPINSPQNSPKLGSRLDKESRTSFAVENSTGRSHEFFSAEEVSVFNKLHKELLAILKKSYDLAWIFDYKPNQESIHQWHSELDANLTQDMGIGHWSDVDFKRNISFGKEGILMADTIVETSLEERIRLLKKFLKNQVSSANAYSTAEKETLIDWMARNGGQELNNFFKINLLGFGCYYDKAKDAPGFAAMNTPNKAKWDINASGQMEMDFTMSVAGLRLDNERVLAFDPLDEKFRILTTDDPHFDEVYRNIKAGNRPIMDFKIKVVLAIENGKVIPIIKENLAMSHTNLLQTPARFEEGKYINDAKFSPLSSPKNSPANSPPNPPKMSRGTKDEA